MVDSGATQTIINNPELLNSKKIKYTLINFLNNKINESNISGKLKIKIGSEILNIDNAILFQNGRRNLLSIIDLLDNNFIFFNQNNKKYLKLFKDNIKQLNIKNSIDTIEINKGLFKIVTKNEPNAKNNNLIENYLVESTNEKVNKIIWHNRFLHYDTNQLINKLKNIKLSLKTCKDCNISKIAKLPNKASNPKAKSRGDLIYSDVLEFNKGKKGVEGVNGENYSVIFVDDFSRK